MLISQNAAFTHLEKHLDTSWNSVAVAGGRWLAQPDLPAFSARTKAASLNDLVHDELVAHFDEVPGVAPQADTTNQMRFLSIDDEILLWPKKVDSQRVKANMMLTDHSHDLISGQINFGFMPAAALIVLGYWFDDEGKLRRISFAPPAAGRPPWYIDLRPADVNVIEMGQQHHQSQTIRTRAGLHIVLSPVQAEM